jgi:ABC-type molybdate transport system substrate-binding protein
LASKTLAWLGVTCLASLLGPGLAHAPAQARPLLVGAASSLKGPLEVLAPSFAKAEKVALPSFHFAASGLLQH